MGSWLLVGVCAVVHVAFKSSSIYRETLSPVAGVDDLCLDLVKTSSHFDIFSGIRADIFKGGFIFQEVSIAQGPVHILGVSRVWTGYGLFALWPW